MIFSGIIKRLVYCLLPYDKLFSFFILPYPPIFSANLRYPPEGVAPCRTFVSTKRFECLYRTWFRGAKLKLFIF
jgi:hypothetical protein